MHPDARTRTQHAVVAVVAAACVAGVHALAVHTSAGRTTDTRVLALVGNLAGMPGADVPATVAGWVRAGLPLVLASTVLVLGVLAIRRGAWRALVASVLLVAGSATLSLVLRDLVLAAPPGSTGTYPSTHVTIVACLCVAGLWLRPAGWPRRETRWVAAALVVVAAAASVATHAHLPSDVLGSVLLVAAVGSLLATALVPSVRP
ncbi:hypothetical protein GCM10009718_26960 [Isoptericola halotolerans]